MPGAVALSLLPPKKKTESRGRKPLVAYKSEWDQYDYIEGLLRHGYSLPEAMAEIVRLHQHLSSRLTDAGVGLTDFAVSEGLVAREGVGEGIAWLPEAVARLVLKGVEAYKRERPSISFADTTEEDAAEADDGEDLLERESREASVQEMAELTNFSPKVVEELARRHGKTPEQIRETLATLPRDAAAKKNPPRPKSKK